MALKPWFIKSDPQSIGKEWAINYMVKCIQHTKTNKSDCDLVNWVMKISAL